MTGFVTDRIDLPALRELVPDIRVTFVRLDDGRRGCIASFTFRGLPYEVEAIESDEVSDLDSEIRRRCLWLIQRTTMPMRADAIRSRQKESQIVEAAARGDAQQAEHLAKELAVSNEARTRRMPVRTRFER